MVLRRSLKLTLSDRRNWSISFSFLVLVSKVERVVVRGGGKGVGIQLGGTVLNIDAGSTGLTLPLGPVTKETSI